MTRNLQRLRLRTLTSSVVVLLISGCFDPASPNPTNKALSGTTGELVPAGSTGGPTSGGTGEPDSGGTTASVETQTGSADDDETGRDDLGESGSGTLVCTETCVSKAAEASYVVVSGKAGEDLACPSGWRADEAMLHRDLNVPDSTCSCSCGAAESFTCPSAEVENHFDGGCTNFSGTTLLPVDACVNVSAFSNFPDFTTTPTDVSCPTVSASDIPTTSWDTDVLLCRAETTSGECEADETCVAGPPPNADVCTVLEGDVACPEGPYSARSVVYGGVDDGRSCSPACACEGSGSCGPTLEFWTTEGCAGESSTVITFETCTNTSSSSARYTTQLLNPACEANNPTPAGTADPSAPQTLCCLS